MARWAHSQAGKLPLGVVVLVAGCGWRTMVDKRLFVGGWALAGLRLAAPGLGPLATVAESRSVGAKRAKIAIAMEAG
jgi:hypothetical protein